MPMNHNRANLKSRASREYREAIAYSLSQPRKPPLVLEPLGGARGSRVTARSAMRASLTHRAKRVKVTLAPVSL